MHKHLALPGELASRDEKTASTERGRIAEICLGIPGPDAASFLIRKLLPEATPQQRLDGRYVEHTARHLNEANCRHYTQSATRSRIRNNDWCSIAASPTASAPAALQLRPPRNKRWPRSLRTSCAAKQEARRKRGIDLAKELRRPELFDDVLPLTMNSAGTAPLRSAAYEAVAACDAAHGSARFSSRCSITFPNRQTSNHGPCSCWAGSTPRPREHADSRPYRFRPLGRGDRRGIGHFEGRCRMLCPPWRPARCRRTVLQEPPVQLCLSRSQPKDYVSRTRRPYQGPAACG